MKVCQTDQSDRSIVVHITVTGSVTSRLEYRQPQLLLIDSFDKKNIFWPRPCSRCNIAMFLVGWFEVDSRKYQEKKKLLLFQSNQSYLFIFYFYFLKPPIGTTLYGLDAFRTLRFLSPDNTWLKSFYRYRVTRIFQNSIHVLCCKLKCFQHSENI